MEVFLALITAVAFGFDAYFIRKGLLKTPYPLVAAFITLTVNISFFAILSIIFVPFTLIKLNFIYLFIVAGIFAPGCARFLSYKGLEILGLSISAPIMNANFLFPVAMALIFLKEPMNLSVAMGVFNVVAGLVWLGFESGQTRDVTFSRPFRYRYLFYPITASLFYGVSTYLRKIALNTAGSTIIGATFTTATSWCILLILLSTTGNLKYLSQVKKPAFIYFIAAGAMTCLGWLSFFHALNVGRITIVSPITSSSSLVTLILSYFLLRNVEHISFKIVIATILVVSGIMLLSLAH
jgi:transporter family protein